MNEFIITEKQIEELNSAHGGMKIVTSWLSCYAIWDTSGACPVMKYERVAIELPNIVRCRDCKYNAEGACEWWGYCDIDDHSNGFCAWGERRPE